MLLKELMGGGIDRSDAASKMGVQVSANCSPQKPTKETAGFSWWIRMVSAEIYGLDSKLNAYTRSNSHST